MTMEKQAFEDVSPIKDGDEHHLQIRTEMERHFWWGLSL